MKQGLKSVAWIVESIQPESVVCLLPDAKASILNLIVGKVRHKMFRYTGLDLPKEAKTKLSKEPKYSGFVFNSLEKPAPTNAVMALCDKDTYPLVWHCPIVLLWGDSAPQGFTKIAEAPGEPAMWMWPKERIPQPKFEVKTRNCVDDKIIQANVINSLNLGLPCIPKMAAHGEMAALMGGGPSIINHMETFRRHVRTPGVRVCCVKTSHDLLIDAGIIPWVCLLLDPRAHVKDFIEHPHPEVLYLASSTCNPTTFDRLLSRGAKVWIYHALVGASEDSLVRMNLETLFKERKRFSDYCREMGIQPPPQMQMGFSDQMVAGGTTAGSRGLAVLHMMGFRKFSLYGFDSCYFEPKDLKERKADGQAKYQHLNVGGRNFYTDAELVAQVQDFQHILNGAMPDCTFDIVGEGMVAQLFKSARQLPQLEQVFPQ